MITPSCGAVYMLHPNISQCTDIVTPRLKWLATGLHSFPILMVLFLRSFSHIRKATWTQDHTYDTCGAAGEGTTNVFSFACVWVVECLHLCVYEH